MRGYLDQRVLRLLVTPFLRLDVVPYVRLLAGPAFLRADEGPPVGVRRRFAEGPPVGVFFRLISNSQF